MKPRQALALFLVGLVAHVGCNNATAKHPTFDGSVIRYRLLLRDNPVSSSDAAHCFVACQSEAAPKAYVNCLSECPGFEKTPGARCSSDEVPPSAVCFTVQRIPAKQEPPAGAVIIGIVADMALMVTTAALCNASSSHCNLYPGPR